MPGTTLSKAFSMRALLEIPGRGWNDVWLNVLPSIHPGALRALDSPCGTRRLNVQDTRATWKKSGFTSLAGHSELPYTL